MTYADTTPTTWQQIRDIVDSLDRTPTRTEYRTGLWVISPDDASVGLGMPDLADAVRPVSASLAGTVVGLDSISVYDVLELSDAQVQDYIRAVKAWHQDTERQAREVAAALVLQAIYAQHHRPSTALPAEDDDEPREDIR